MQETSSFYQPFYPNDDMNAYFPSQNLGTAMALSLGNPYLELPMLSENNCEISQDDDKLEPWKTKPIKEWENSDIVQWINNAARELGICCTEMAGERFGGIDGNTLYSFTRENFKNYDKLYGNTLYNKLKDLKAKEDGEVVIKQEIDDDNDEKNSDFEIPILTYLDSNKDSQPLVDYLPNEIKANTSASSSKDASEENNATEPESPDSPLPQPRKKRPGRPPGTGRKKKPEKLGRLWEFLRDLLKNRKYCPELIVWDNYEEGMFRFVNSDKVAKLWGTKKDNPDMNYEKLSRAMRYYYKSQVLQPVIGRRLVYKFGPTATGWRVDNPNFKD